ncbi:fatty acid desaturase [Maritimibacter sp. 55A14]|uniref:fatty acid desaturase n=1 Tax=Maritimibacter sp. 55A14 TaxID=2174844 RepID=UPI000D61FABF|nr:fatty acid desaturase [Maritimibacter sp. 55A14]PWE33847.1 fatty acid desaturase [Maritimibacter sp. 55A14]
MITAPRGRAEWPTLALLAACYGLWGLGTTVLAALSPPLAVGLVALCVTLHSSLCHEALHGHPFRARAFNAALVFPALGLFVPYARFRDTHLAHHRDERLTDPYDDPESNYLDPAAWARLPAVLRVLLRANNTLAGRVLIGPALSLARFIAGDIRRIARGDGSVAAAWAWHMAALLPVWLRLDLVAAMPPAAYLLAVYLGHGILKIRTFLEHRAHVCVAARTVIVADRGPLALLFLNNNLHAVHHAHPGLPWYRLPARHAVDAQGYLARNGGYFYRSYAAVIRRYLFRAKDPVAHPLRPAPEPALQHPAGAAGAGCQAGVKVSASALRQ